MRTAIHLFSTGLSTAWELVASGRHRLFSAAGLRAVASACYDRAP